MITIGNQIVTREKDFNEEIFKIQGEMDEIQAKITLAKFLRQNIGFTFEYLSGVELLPLQEILLKVILKKDNGLVVAGRGTGKSFLISVLAILYPLFYFNSKMCIISTNFRGSRRILEESEKMINSKKAKLLKQCYEGSIKNTRNIIQRAPDRYIISLKDPTNSEVFSLPLTEGLRGTRASFVVIDEAVGIQKSIQEEVIRPFLTARQNMQEEIDIKKIEDELIRLGKITENDRISFPKNKFCAFSSASYQFEYLYENYQNIIDQIMKKDQTPENTSNSFCIRFSYEALPPNSIIDMTQINEAKKAGGENTTYFKKEYRALFTDSSNSYFNIKKMNDCTIRIGNYPTTQIKGDKNSEYILSIDPSYAQNRSSDYFGLQLHLINKEERKTILVHNYARAGGELKDHFEYMVYLLTYFNIIFIVIDDSGTEFITGFNESTTAQSKNIKLDFIKADFDTDDYTEYQKALQKAKNEYNLTNRRIVYAQKFSSANGSIRRMNECLQNHIEAERVWFASNCRANEKAFDRYKEVILPFDFKNNKEQILDIGDFIELQDELIKETKAETSLIEVRSTVTGTMQFDLPQNLRRSTSENRARKDLYTCLLLANWSAKIYFDMIFCPVEENNNYFSPIIIK